MSIELLDLPQDIIRLILIKLPTRLIINLFLKNRLLYEIGQSSNFWSDKLGENYPLYMDGLLNDSYSQTLAMLDKGREICFYIFTGILYKYITIDTTFADLISCFNDQSNIHIRIKSFIYKEIKFPIGAYIYIKIYDDKIIFTRPDIGWTNNSSIYTPLYSIKLMENKRLYYELTEISSDS